MAQAVPNNPWPLNPFSQPLSASTSSCLSPGRDVRWVPTLALPVAGVGSASLLPASPTPPILPFCIHHRQVLEAFPARFAGALVGLDFALVPVAGRRCLDNKRMWQCWPWIITPVPLPSCAPPPLACHEFPAFLVFPESLVQPEFLRHSSNAHPISLPSPG